MREPDGAIQDAILLLEQKKEIFLYRAVIMDEAQDMGPQAFMLLKRMLPEAENDLFIAGDAHDIVVKREHEVRERALLYVSATRAKNDVWVTSYGRGSRFLENF